MPSADEAIGTLYHQAAHVVGAAGGPSSAQHVESAYKTLTAFAHYGDQLSLGLFPLALALLIFHENFQAGTGDGRFRVAYVLGRAAAVAALIHPWTYGRLCGLITFAAGGHGGWLSADALLGSVTKSVDGLKGAWTDFAGDDPGISDSFSALINILPLVGIWLVLVCALLFAYIAGVLLSLSQAVILSILLAVGKTCITVTLVPGVGLGSSWARSLAKVAAWSTIAGVITALMVHAMPDLREMVRNMAYTAMLRTAGQFVVLAICTFSIPVITEKIFSGAAPAGNAALEAVSKGWQGAKTMNRFFGGSAARDERAGASPSGAPGRGGSPRGDGGDSAVARPHKVPPSRLRQGLVAMGSLAAVPLAGAVALVTRRTSSNERARESSFFGPGQRKASSAENGDEGRGLAATGATPRGTAATSQPPMSSHHAVVTGSPNHTIHAPRAPDGQPQLRREVALGNSTSEPPVARPVRLERGDAGPSAIRSQPARSIEPRAAPDRPRDAGAGAASRAGAQRPGDFAHARGVPHGGEAAAPPARPGEARAPASSGDMRGAQAKPTSAVATSGRASPPPSPTSNPPAAAAAPGTERPARALPPRRQPARPADEPPPAIRREVKA